MTRRLIWLIGTVVALAAIGGFLFHVFDPTRTSGSTLQHRTASQREPDLGEQNGGIAYGDTATQVVAKLGSPSRKEAACWIYNAEAHTVNGQYLAKVIDKVKYCFGQGPVGGKVVSTIYEHLIPSAIATLPEGERPNGGWIHPFNIASPGSAKLRF